MSNTQFSCCHLLFQLVLGRMRNLPNLINFDFRALFWKDGWLLKTETSSFWKQATTNSIQDDKQFPFQATTLATTHQQLCQQTTSTFHDLFDNTLNKENGNTATATTTMLVSDVSCISSSFTNSLYFTRLFTDYGWPPPPNTITTTAALGRFFIFILFHQHDFLYIEIDDPARKGPKRGLGISFGPR